MQELKLFFQNKFPALFQPFVALFTLLAMLLPFNADRITAQMEGPAATDSTQIVFTVTNNSRRTIYYRARGAQYELLADGDWSRLQSAPAELVEDDFAYGLSPHAAATFPLSPKTSLAQPMAPGRYRFVLPYWLSFDDINAKEPAGRVTLEFTLSAP